MIDQRGLDQALAEFGRIDKTLHTLNYIDDEDKRRAILVQINRGESRHSLARNVFHGRRGELRQRYREGQEDQLGTLGLVVNVIILWNTILYGCNIEPAMPLVDAFRIIDRIVRQILAAMIYFPCFHKKLNVLEILPLNLFRKIGFHKWDE